MRAAPAGAVHSASSRRTSATPPDAPPPIAARNLTRLIPRPRAVCASLLAAATRIGLGVKLPGGMLSGDRKSTRLNSSHLVISYAVFCLKKKKKDHKHQDQGSSQRV